MKKIFVLPLLIALSLFCSCPKQQTDAERTAEIDRVVQQRLDAERQAQEKEQLAQREGELNAREKALADQENAASKGREPESRQPESRPIRTEQRTVRSDDERPTGSYDTFYTKLDSHGEWRETSDYGYVFQPREAERSRTWRPYTDGHWVYSDVGWTWVSEEPHGWATYHYGRWTRLRNIGWVWVPGDEWAPAWVSWRKSDDYVGWAPLPPEARFDRRTGIHNWSDNYYDIGPEQYSFVETRQFGAPRIQSSVVPTERNVMIVNQTTNVTNITYSNTTVVNQGPSYDEIRTRTQQPIARLRIDRQVKIDVNVGAPQSVVRGEMVVIPAPLIARGQAVERPRRVKETVARVEVDRGWENLGDRQAVEKVRVKMKAEATPPPNAPSKIFVKPAQAWAESSPASATSTSSPAATPARAEAEATATVAATATATPAPAPAQRVTPEPAATATATPTATPPVRATQTPSPTVTPAPSVSDAAATSPTPKIVRRALSSPAASAAAAQGITVPTVPPKATPSLSPIPSEIGTPRPVATPRPTERSTSASPASSPVASPSATASASPALTQSPRPLREDRARPAPQATTSPSPTPSVSASPSVSPADLSKGERREMRLEERAVRKEEKRERKRGEAGSAESAATPTPTPTPAP